MPIRTLIPHRKDRYSAFPTFVEYDDKLFVFYRQGIKSDYQCHGLEGIVKCAIIEKKKLLHAFDSDSDESDLHLDEDFIVFAGNNELDAIVSRLDENLFSLATRTYIKGEEGQTFISTSDKPFFRDRRVLKVSGIEWLVFYGKAIKCAMGYLFTAYGVLEGQSYERPLLLLTTDFVSWKLLHAFQSNFNGSILNECSIIFTGNGYTIFFRDDSEKAGIHYSTSTDLTTWSEPVKLLSHAHAPMAAYVNGDVYLTFRQLISESESGVTLSLPFTDLKQMAIEKYKGDPFDGGYTDLGIIDNRLFVVYYAGNETGEPCIKIYSSQFPVL